MFLIFWFYLRGVVGELKLKQFFGKLQRILFLIIELIFLQIRRDGVLLLRSLDSRLSKDLPSDLQKLRCKVNLILLVL